MHIVIFGLSLSSSWGNGHATTYRSLVKGLAACGHRVTFFERDVPWYAENRDLHRFAHGRLELYDSLEALIRDHQALVAGADAVIVGSYVPQAPRLIDWLVHVAGAPGNAPPALCYYDIDTPVTLEALADGSCEYLRADQIPRFDLYFSFAGGRALGRLAGLGARRPRVLYCSVDPGLYRPLAAARRSGYRPRWAMGYMGTYADDRQPAVERLLLEVARRRPDERFVVAGPGYPGTQSWPENVDWIPHLPPAEHRAFYGDQRVTLNVTRAAMVALGHAPSVRLFEAAACGCCIITDTWPGLDEVLEPGREVLTADSADSVTAHLDRLTPAGATAIGDAARARVLREHSHLRRAELLVRCLDEVLETDRATT